jgi:uridylate kinase
MHATLPVDPRVKYKRIILKLSGELLRGEKTGDPIDADALERTCKQVKEIHELGVQICVVIGGGNIFRGLNPARSAGSTGRPATTWACWRPSSTAWRSWTGSRRWAS